MYIKDLRTTDVAKEQRRLMTTDCLTYDPRFEWYMWEIYNQMRDDER